MEVSEVLMQLVFRKFPAQDVPPPAAGEVYVRPAVNGAAGRDLRHSS